MTLITNYKGRGEMFAQYKVRGGKIVRAGACALVALLFILPVNAKVEPIITDKERREALKEAATAGTDVSAIAAGEATQTTLDPEEYIKLLVELEAAVEIARLEKDRAEAVAATERAKAEAKAASSGEFTPGLGGQLGAGGDATSPSVLEELNQAAQNASTRYTLQWVGKGVDQHWEAKVYVRDPDLGSYVRTLRKGMRLDSFDVSDVDKTGVVLQDDLERQFRLRF